MNVRVRHLVVLAMVTLVAGCGAGAGLPPAGGPATKSPAAGIAAVPTSRLATHRTARISTPQGMYPQTVEFSDAIHGYVQYVTREPVSGAGSADPNDLRYRAALFATADGGQTWTSLRHPRPVSNNPQLYVVDARTFMIYAEPYGWYVTADGGRTYRHDPPDPTSQYLPPEYERIWQNPAGPFTLDCADEPCAVSRIEAAGAVTRLPRQPTMTAPVRALATAGGLLWVAGTDADRRPQVQVSADQGNTWRSVALPAQPAYGERGLDWVEVRTSSDSADVWLVGYPGDGGTAGAAAPLAALKVVGMPVVWRAQGDAMVAKGVIARPTPGQNPALYTAAAIGGGMLAVSGPGCLCLVDDAWISVPTPQPIEFIRTLADGTIYGSAITNKTVYLGTRTGREVAWVEVELP